MGSTKNFNFCIISMEPEVKPRFAFFEHVSNY